MSRLLDRADLSFRKTRTTKRATVDDEACAHFPVPSAAVQAESPVKGILTSMNQAGGQLRRLKNRSPNAEPRVSLDLQE
jgi:hypothetical protein